MAEDVLQLPLQFLKGVGPRKAADLKKAGLHTVEDLLFRFPRRYEDRSKLQTIISLRPGMTAAISGEVLNAGLAQTRRPGFRLFQALVQDPSGQIQVVWPNQAFLKDVIRPHQRLVLFGKVEFWGSRGLQITDPEFEIVKDSTDPDGSREIDTLHTGRIVPVYERTGSVTPNMQRRFVWQALEQVTPDGFDPVPLDILAKEQWPSRRDALWQTHFPEASTPVDALNAFATPAQRRLIFEDFFVFQTGLALRRHENAQVRKGLVCVVDDRIRECARAVLPFKLTPGQRDALLEIVTDLQRPWPMQRLLQGDVGAGKTIVAVLAAVVAMENGFQVAVMAPTEILAEQHYRTIVKVLDGRPYRTALLTGRVTAATRRDLLPAIERGEINLVVGTQALVQDHVKFKALALAVIDEQHRFGVVQRGTLAAKGLNPDVLVMTATPIPRTLALTECGDMEVSVIRGLPPGRQPVRTLVKADSRRDEVYQMIRDEIRQGRQVYVIYPLVEESEKIDLKAATAMAEELTRVFPEFTVSLLHGRMKGDEKERVMHAFTSGAL
ncbi:MAG: ATP-dependent DNA helicase RecG, partial [Acidobacteriota bacterium]|nr:ATP-dependent DNA helicase RecG [Acidobacteriota bacterium]